METKTYKVVGGMLDISYRSTSLAVECKDTQDGYDKVTYWARTNFTDFNHIDILPDGKPLLGLVNVKLPTSVYCSGKSFRRG